MNGGLASGAWWVSPAVVKRENANASTGKVNADHSAIFPWQIHHETLRSRDPVR